MCFNIPSQFVYKDPKIASFKRHAFEADSKLNAVNHTLEHWNRTAARESNIQDSKVRKWRKQEDNLDQVKTTKQSFREKLVSLNVPYNLVRLIVQKIR